jgi:hypothetical protein
MRSRDNPSRRLGLCAATPIPARGHRREVLTGEGGKGLGVELLAPAMAAPVLQSLHKRLNRGEARSPCLGITGEGGGRASSLSAPSVGAEQGRGGGSELLPVLLRKEEG